MPDPAEVRRLVAARLVARNPVSRRFFADQADRLAAACREMSERFLRGGRLLAFGREQSATDAQHVAVEFVHPVIVGKRALPALDLSAAFSRWLPAVVRSDDVVMGFAPPDGDAEVAAALAVARRKGAQTFALPGPAGDDAAATAAGAPAGDYAVDAPSPDPYIAQEILEVLYHTLWETVHVFFEHHELGHDVGQSGFLYPFLGKDKQDTRGVLGTVAASIAAKAEEDEALREQVAEGQSERIAAAAVAMAERFAAGGSLLVFGNGGSATDANDLALDASIPLAAPAATPLRRGHSPVPAISLAMEPANATAIANDVGAEAIFLRQLIAQARPGDVAFAISTSGGSANILAALEEAQKRDLLTVALLGYDGGETVRRGLAEHPLVVRCDYIPRIQEIQATIYHVLLETLEHLETAERDG